MSFLETKNKDVLYAIFRIGIGALFFMFGVQKLFGLWGMPGGSASFGTLIWFAGAGEFLIGLGLVLGVFTRLAALFGVIEMLVAYYLGHASVNGWNPATNQGVPALLFMFAFIAIVAYGAKTLSLEGAVFRKEFF